MKKIFSKMMCCAIALCATACLVACNKNDDPAPAPALTGNVTYSINVYDLKDLMDVSVLYVDAKGQRVVEVVTGATWTKTIENVKIPFLAALEITYKKKANISYAKDSYTTPGYTGWALSCKFSNGKGWTVDESKPLVVPKNEMDKYLNQLAEFGSSMSKVVNVE